MNRSHYSHVLSQICILCIVIISTVSFAAEPKEPADDFAGKVKLILPATIYAVRGIEVNIYFDNVIQVINSANYAFDVTCSAGLQLSDRWTFTPDGNEPEKIPFLLEVHDETNAVIARAHSTIHVTHSKAAPPETKITCLIIGDSLTQAAVYPQQILNRFSGPGNPHLTLVGSRGEGLNKFEGYGGWTAQRYATHYTGIAHTGYYRECGSPFIYKDANNPPRFDFKRYCVEFNGGKAPDFVAILLGCNDTFLKNDNNIEAAIDTMLENYDFLLSQIRLAGKNTIIGVIPPPPSAASQDAFGATDQCTQTLWQYKRNHRRLLERMIQKYGNSENKNIFIVPIYVNLDCVDGYPRDPKTGKLCNSVHPSDRGYRQIGDSIYCWMKNVMAEKQ